MSEKRLIDANGSFAVDARDGSGCQLTFCGGTIDVRDRYGYLIGRFFADDMRTVDAVEAVRCRECVYYEHILGGLGGVEPYCRMWGEGTEKDGFCSCGEKERRSVAEGDER